MLSAKALGFKLIMALKKGSLGTIWEWEVER